MQELVQVASVNDFQPGSLRMVNVGGHEYLLARVEDKYYAADNHCPHMGGNLSHGKLEGSIITCPRHGSQFDLKDGHVVRWTTWPSALVTVDQVRSRRRPLPVYPVVVEGDKILLKNTRVTASNKA
jgi:3-phenylpropionate/trans-cinnamate dioxygenase ferredoxin component